MKLSDNIKYVDKMLKRRSGDRFKLIYKFTTENIAGYINVFDLKDKTLLTVGSSGDQIINSNFCGCNDVTVIDLNSFTYHYFNLKKAALFTLNYEDFLKFFSLPNNECFMPKNTYSIIRDELRMIDLGSLSFWDYVYDNKYWRYRYNLFHYQENEHANIKAFNKYLYNEGNYDKEKERIKYLKVKFINGNILECNKIFKLEKFDNINLSNIYSYNKSNFKIKKFKNSVKYLTETLNDEGKMLVAYLTTSYGGEKIDSIDKNIIDNQKIISFQGIWGIYKGDESKDTVIMYEKRKKLDKRNSNVIN